MKLNANNRFDLETWNLQGQDHRKRSPWVELIKVHLHVEFERVIVNGHSVMNFNARAIKTKLLMQTGGQTDGQTDGTVS